MDKLNRMSVLLVGGPNKGRILSHYMGEKVISLCRIGKRTKPPFFEDMPKTMRMPDLEVYRLCEWLTVSEPIAQPLSIFVVDGLPTGESLIPEIKKALSIANYKGFGESIGAFIANRKSLTELICKRPLLSGGSYIYEGTLQDYLEKNYLTRNSDFRELTNYQYIELAFILGWLSRPFSQVYDDTRTRAILETPEGLYIYSLIWGESFNTYSLMTRINNFI